MERDEITMEKNGFYAFRTGWPKYNDSIFKDKVEIVTDGRGTIISVTNPLSLKFAFIPEKAEGIEIIGIGERAFSQCKNLRSIVFSSSVISCASFAFYSCTFLEECVFSSPYVDFGEGVFASSGIKTFSFPPKNRKIPGKFFQDAKRLYKVDMPENLSALGTLCFAGTKSLLSIDLGFSLKSIPDGAFLSSALESISLPHSIRRIGVSSFSQGRNLKSIWFDGTSEDFRSISFGHNWNKDIDKDAVLYIKDREGRWYNAFSNKKEEKENKPQERKEVLDSLKIMGFERMPDREELGERYRSLVRKFHPDTLIHLNLDKEYMDFASKRFNEIHDAYFFLLPYAK